MVSETREYLVKTPGEVNGDKESVPVQDKVRSLEKVD
jgi:hypothetical protein